jgi:hypothetical protein
MTLANLAKSFARTAIPYVVGVVIALALRAGLDLNGYAPEITVAVGSLYYALVRLAEEHLSPQFGWLLGVAGKPDYGKAKKA